MQVYLFVTAIITNYHRLDGLEQKSTFSSSEGEFKIEVLTGLLGAWFLLRTLAMPQNGLFSVSLCPQYFFICPNFLFFEDISQIRQDSA